MARDLFAEIGSKPAASNASSEPSGPRDLFSEIGFKPGESSPPRQRSVAEPRKGKTEDVAPRTRAAAAPRQGKAEKPLDRGTSAPVAATTQRMGLGVGTNLSGAMAVPETVQQRFARESQNDPSNGLVIGKPQASYDRPAPTFGSYTGGLGRNFAHSTLQQGLGAAQAVVDFAPGLSQDARDLATDKITDWTQRSQQIVQQTTPGFKTQAAEDIYGGAANLVQNIPGMAASILTGNPTVGIAMAGAQTGSQAYGKYRLRGGTPGEAALGGGLEGAFEMIGEKIPMGTLVEKFGKAKASKWLGEFLLQEMGTEQATTFAQDAVDTAIANPNKTWGDFWRERPEAAKQTAIAVAMMGGAVGAANTAVRAPSEIIARRAAAARYNAAINAAAVNAFDPNAATAPQPRTVTTPGIREAATQQAATITPEDEASPLPTDDIVAGRVEVAKATAGNQADSGLRNAGMPTVGKRVAVTDHETGAVQHGTMEDWFEAEDGKGVVVRLDDGKILRNYLDDLADANVSITDAAGTRTAEADALDAQLAAAASESAPVQGSVTTSPGAVPVAAQGAETAPPRSGTGRPVADGGAVIRSIFGDGVRITSTRRSKDDPLTTKNPGSWHAKSNAAVDMAPIPGQTFEQTRARIEAAGYHLIEAIDEVKHPSGHATGPHWHFVIGEGRSPAATAAPSMVESTTAPEREDAPFEPTAAPDVFADDKPRTLPDSMDEVDGGDAVGFEYNGSRLEVTRTASDGYQVDRGTTVQTFTKAQLNDLAEREGWVRSTRTRAEAAAAERAYGRVRAQIMADARSRAVEAGIPNDHIDKWANGYRMGLEGDPMPASFHTEAGQWFKYGYEAGQEQSAQQATPTPSTPAGPTSQSAVSAEDTAPTAQHPAQETTQRDPEPQPTAAPASTARVEPTPSGKGVAVIGASEAELAAIARDVPQAKGAKRADGAWTYSLKHADAIRAAIAGVAPASPAPATQRNQDVTGTSPASPAPRMSRDQIANRLAEVLGHQRGDMHNGIADAIHDKDFWLLRGRLEPHNKKSRQVFTEATGIKLPENKAGTEEALRQYTGISREEIDRVRKESSDRREADKAERHRQRVRSDAEGMKVRDENGQETTAAAWIDRKIAEGFDDLVNTSNGAVPKWALRNRSTGRGFHVTKDLLAYARVALEDHTSTWDGLTDDERNDPNLATPEELDHLFGKDRVPAPTGTAPEHAQVGVDDRELSEIVRDFDEVRRSQGEGENQVTHVFDPPAKGEVVRLADKVKVYNEQHGWMTPAEAAARIAEWKAHAEKQGGPGSPNADKVVLSLFDLSGEWSKPWEEAGYQVYRFDIQADPEVGDVHNFSTEFFSDWFGDFEGQDIYAILAATPCTDFAVSGARHFAAKDADGRTVASVKLVHQTLATIEHFKPAVWAIENPVGRIEKLGGLPPWRLSFDPNHVGETYTKKTLLWGRFNGDLPIAPVEPVEGSKMHRLYGGKSMATKNARSVTPEGFAYSFFMANNAVDHPVLALAGKYDRLDRDVLDKAIKAGVKPAEISEAVDDLYYMEMDDEGANQAVRDLIEQRRQAKMGARPKAPLTAAEQAELDRLKADNANGDLGDDADVERMLDLQKKAAKGGSLSDTPRAEARKAGVKAWAEGKRRVAANEVDPGVRVEWYAGWDSANLAAPVENDQAYRDALLRGADVVDAVETAAKAAAGNTENTGNTAAKPKKRPKDDENPHLRKGDRVRVTQEIPGEYVRAGDTYLVERADKGSAYFRHVESGSGTSIQNWRLKQALASGAIERIEEPAYRGAGETPNDLEDAILALSGDEYVRYLEALNPPRPTNRNASTSRAAQIQHQFNTMGEIAMRKALGKPTAALTKGAPVAAKAVEATSLDDFIGKIDAGERVHFSYGGVDGRTVWIEETPHGWTVNTRDDDRPNYTSQIGGAGAGGGWSKGEALRRAEEGARHRFTQWKPMAGEAPTPVASRTVAAKKVGDFYEFYDQDARTVAEALGLTLTQRNGHDMTGIPAWSMESHRADLAAKGIKVVAPGLDQEAAPQKTAVSAAEPASASNPDQKGKFAGNKVFTEDKVAAARARLREKMNRLNAGIDPELLMDGIVIAGAHIESGVRRFADVARALADDLGTSMAALKPYLRAWYNGARDMLEDSGEDVSDMDGPGAVKAALTMIDDQATAPAEGAMEGSDVELPNRVPASDAGPVANDVPGTSPNRSDGSAPRPEGRGSAGDVRATDRGSAQAAERSPGESAGRAAGNRVGDANADRVSAAGRDTGSTRAAADAVKGTDWTIAPGSLGEDRSMMQKARDNVAAIELVKKIEAEGRPATHEEQAIIARYIGWGGIKNVFPDTAGQYGKGFEELGRRLREILTDEEYETARRSIQYAHYTAEPVVRGMWDIARQLGFKGGLVFEPGMGVGNFRGMMPADIAAASSYQGLEYDHLTATIAKLLYPQSGVRQADYTATPQVMDAFDLVIGNPPFSETTIKSDPAYAQNAFVLHDFFFAKSLDAVKPGGLLMFISSAGTMNKLGDKARAYMADRADLVGAIRLPGNAFEQNAGTSVTTDIVILRKRLASEVAGDRSWVDVAPVNLPDREGNTIQGNVNRYFIAHPEMVLGEQGMFDKLVAGPRYAVRARPGFDMARELAAAAERLPANVMGSTPSLAVADTAPAMDFTSDEKKDGSYYLDPDGRLMQFRGGVGRPVEGRGKGKTGGMSAKDQEKVRALVPVKDALRAVYAADISDDATKGALAREKLNAVYDAFVKKFGAINKTEISYRRPSRVEIETMRAEAREEARLAGAEWDDGSFDVEPYIAQGATMAEIARARAEAREAAKDAGRIWNEGTFDPEEIPDKVVEKRPNLDPFMEDEEGYRLAAIEHYNKDSGEAAKGRAFYENAIKLDAKPAIRSADDALLYSLNRLGRPDLGVIADMIGKSRGEVLEELGDRLFEVPGRPGVYETAEMYLAGNVREKLAVARAEAARDPAFARNAKALEAALPAPLTPSEISANLGMPWLPPRTIEQFATEHMGLESAKVSYLPKLAAWTAAGDSYSAAARSTWGTQRMDAMALLEAALNRQTPQIYDRTDDGKRVLNPTDTQAAQDKLAEIKQAFRDWIWKDEDRAARLTDLYNQSYNSLVAPKFDGSYLTTPGIASGWSWRPHQRAVIARIIQAGNTYMAHEVGAGKTSAMIGAGMEMKRLGLVNKPMYVVPNHMLGQFTKEFYEQYPLARIRVADETRFHTSRRKEFIARMAADDLDAVIITHSAFGFIPMSDQFMKNMVEQQISELEDLLSEIDKTDRQTRRKVEQQKEALEQRLKGLMNRKRDQVFTFEETGVDFLFVDEAHLFRKLDFSTKMGNVKGIDPNGSAMSFDLFAKTRHLESVKPGRNLVLASGTPITNTMAELFSVSRYLQQGELDKRGLAHFDAWAGAFGDTVTSLEQDPAGGYKPITRFAQFVNVPELSVMVRQVMDVVSAAELRQYVSLPTLVGGERQMVMAEQTPDQERYQAVLKARMEAIQRRSGPPQKGDDIILSVIGDGRKAAIDYRLIDASAERDTGSKLERMIDNVARLHKEFTKTPFHAPLPNGEGFSAKPVTYGPATQMIFSDFGINGDFPVHKYIRQSLVARGIPAGQVAIISDFKTHVAKQRLFNDMNEGKVRVLIGSVAKMGTGVNAQKRLRALHNMDAQWFPANDTQRNGRIIRQGNMNPEVGIYDYATKGTYDSTMWGLMAKKAKFIEGFMRGDPTMRDMEDLGEASQYEQAQAMTTADPRIMELTEWKQEAEKLYRRKVAHERDQQSARSKIRWAENDKAAAEKLIPVIEQDIAKRRLPADGEDFTGTVKGQVYDDRAEFGAALMEAMDDLVDRAKGKTLREGVGELAGFPLVAETHPGVDGPVAVYTIKRAGDRETTVKDAGDARGLTLRLTNALARFEKEVDEQRATIAHADRIIADYTPRIGQAFTEGDKIATLNAKIDALESTLKAESEAAKQAANAAAQQEGEAKQSLPDDLPIVSIQGAEWGKLPRPGATRLAILRDRVSRWYDGLIGTTVQSSDGRTVRFNRAGMKKTLRGGEDLMMLARAIPKIIQRGKLIESQPSGRPGMVAAHRYAAMVRDEAGNAMPLVVVVREAADGTFHYSLNKMVDGARDASAEADREAKKAFAPALEGGARDTLNLEVLQSPGKPAPADLAADLQARLEGYGIARKVALRVVDTLNGAAGDYRNLLVRIATDTTQGETFTLDHEVVHALRDLGLINPSEWAVLAAKAKRDTGLMRSIKGRYAKLDAEGQSEEAVADMFARHQRGDYRSEGTVARVFKRLAQALEAIRNFLARRGAQTAEGVMGRMASGEIGARSGEVSNGPARESRPEPENMVSLGGQEPTWRGDMAVAYEKWRTRIQDRYMPLLKVQREIEQQTGQALPISRNPYLGEELMTGRIGAQLERLAEDHVEPLFDAMHEEGITLDQLETYLYARHAPERNARIAEINPEFEEGSGSGMTDIQARAVMNRIRREGQMDAMERLAARVDALRDLALDTQVRTGLISASDAADLRATYQHYIPLRGFAEVEDADPAVADRINRSGGGINVRGRESKAAYGRRSKADSPLAYLILQAEGAIVRGETNLVAQKFVNLAKANPDEDFWQVNKVTHKQRINEETGLVERYLSRNLAAADADWTVSAKFGGVERRVTMNRANPAARRLADSMRNLTQHQLDWVTLHLGKVNRFLSAVNTSYNPEFIITNAFRDIQTAAFNLSGEEIQGLTRGVLKDYRAALAASTKGAFGKHSGEWGRWYDEFIAEGGRVYFNKIENVSEIKGRIEKIAAMTSAKHGQGGMGMQAKRLLLAAGDMIESLNNGVENAVRLAVYKNARERGLSPTLAASMAKNVTVNFNRRGTAGPALNAAYLFFNASVQGSARIIKSLRSKRVRKMLAGVMITGAMVELLNAMVSSDDDDGEAIYDKIPEYEKSRNIIIMLPGGRDYVKIPTPYGYNVFWEAGRSLAEVYRRGGRGWKETGANLLVTAFDAFNPIGGSDGLLKMISPTVTDPLVDLALNRDYTGKAIMPEENQYGPQEPDHRRYWGSVAPHWKAVTDFLAESTGGDDVTPGWIDVSPETLEYLSGTVVGSAGAFVNRTASLVGKGFDPDEDVTSNDIPFARKVVGSKPAWYDKSAFYGRLGEVEQQVHYAKGYIEAGQMDDARAFAQGERPVLSLEADAKAARRDMRKVRKARAANQAAFDRGRISSDTYRANKQTVEQAEKAVIRQFNSRWNAVVTGGDSGQ